MKTVLGYRICKVALGSDKFDEKKIANPEFRKQQIKHENISMACPSFLYPFIS